MKYLDFFTKSHTALWLLLAFTFISQVQSQTIALVQAEFTYAPSQSEEYSISFFLSDTTWDGNLDSFYLDFGNDSSIVGSMPQGENLLASHTYDEAGIYNVCLTTKDMEGVKNSVCQDVFVKEPGVVTNERIHEGSFSILYEVDPTDKFAYTFTPSFTEQDSLSYYWDFGDGFSSTAYAPEHTFQNSRKYWVKLMIRDNNRVYSTSTLVDVDLAECHTDFDIALIDSNTIRVTNRSALNIKYHYWTFDDGRTKIQTSPSDIEHRYKKPGIYNIVLFTMDSTETYTCVNFKRKKIRIGRVGCNADFSYFIDTLSGSNMGYFKANAIGLNPSYNWTFGDGKQYHRPLVVHPFTKPGLNKVKLSVKTKACVNTKEESILISGQEGDCEADFNHFIVTQGTDNVLLQLNDNSIGQDLSYTWRVGDSILPSTENKASYMTSNSGYTHNVCLTINNSTVSNTTCKKIYLPNPNATPCQADFSFFVDTLTNKVSFQNKSIGEKTTFGIPALHWDFGDGQNSNIPNPVHQYDEPGYYKIALEIECQNPVDLLRKKRYAYELADVNTRNNILKGDFVMNRNPTRFKVSGYPVDFVGISHGDAAKIRWDFENDGVIDDSTSTTPTWYYPETDSLYTCCYYIEDPITGIEDQVCRPLNAKTGEFTDEETGISSITSLVSQFDVYPNPVVNGMALAQFTLSETAQVLLTLFDARGQAISTLENSLFTAGEYTSLLDANGLTKGVYYLQLIANRQSSVLKIVVR